MTRPREVAVKQSELDLGLDRDVATPRVAFPPNVHAALVRLMALALIAVHPSTKEVGDDDSHRASEDHP